MCIRQIGKLSGAAIKSWTDQPSMPANTHRACRNFLIQVGTLTAVVVLPALFVLEIARSILPTQGMFATPAECKLQQRYLRAAQCYQA